MTYLVRLRTANGDPSLPVIYRDSAIGAETVGMIDLSNTWCYGGASPAVIGGVVQDLVRGRTAATIKASSAFTGSGLTYGAGEMIRLGDHWRLPAASQKYGFIMWASLQRAGYATGSGVGYAMAGGLWAADVGAQYLIGLVIDRASGAATAVRYMFGASGACDIPADVYASGVPRQYGLEIDASGATRKLRAYVDGVLIAEAIGANAGSIPTPAMTSYPMLGKAPGWTYAALGKTYAASLHDLTVSGARSFADILTADIASRAGRFV